MPRLGFVVALDARMDSSESLLVDSRSLARLYLGCFEVIPVFSKLLCKAMICACNDLTLLSKLCSS